VAVKDAAQVLAGDELRKLTFQGRLDLAAPFPELNRGVYFRDADGRVLELIVLELMTVPQ
jgi:hypothetical protein